MGILLMQELKDLLGDILGLLPSITRCREGDNPFTQQLEYLVTFHG
ncbi:MAG: hypothetical protein LC126_20415 [Bryobacterales bacterium]|nr:hypothetical protein [Bryobacterales bacterium]